MRTIVIIVTTLATLLVVGCAVIIVARSFSPATGMGAIFSTPEAALQDALGPQGWLDRTAQITLLAQATTAEGLVVVYAGQPTQTAPPAATRWLGLADAKRGWRGWYAHGRFALPMPPALPSSNALTCATVEIPSSSERFLVVTGFADADVVQVVVAFGAQTVQTDVRDGAFAALGVDANAVTALTAIDQRGGSVSVDPVACVTQ